MSLPTLLLVLLAAVLHAAWNYLAKTIPSGAPFVWLLAVVMTLLLLPFALGHLLLFGFQCTPLNISALLITGILHLVYFLVLQKGYQTGDLSMVYPLARGSGPVFATIGALLFLGERMSGMAVLGLSLVVAGVLLISGTGKASADPAKRRKSIATGIFTGLLIACYTVFDGYAVKQLAIAPILLEFSSSPIRVLALSPAARRRWPEIRSVWQAHRWKIMAIGVMAPFGFILILYAMKVAPVHLVAPTRELSIVLGVILGAKLLTEENFRQRLAGSLLILAGIVFLSL